MTLCISREAGSRGGSIARRVGELLGWQVFNQELLGYLSQNDASRREIQADVPAAATPWIEDQLASLARAGRPVADPQSAELVRLILTLAVRGESIIVGRGAGALLPVETTLNVRIIAPLEQRVAYMSQWLRLSIAEAREELAARDRIRAAWHASFAGRDVADLTQYDLILNTGRLGVAGSAELIADAVRGKHLPAEPALAEREWPAVDPV